ncbi:MAG: DNA repair protein RecO [Clostridia bacterium]|nr:DNA repair protein RecO [Clostridia bacterium]
MANADLSFKGLVLRSTDVGDNDKLLTVISAEYGKISFSVKGARSLKSKFMPVSQQFAYADFTVAAKGGFKYLRDATLIESFFSLRADLVTLALASYIASVTEQLSLENEPDTALLRLALNSLYVLSEGKYPAPRVKAVFELSAVSVSGFAPELDFCGNCSKRTELAYFDVVGGVLLCADCVRSLYAQAEMPITIIPVSAGIVDAMRYVSGETKKNIFSFKLPDDEDALFCDLCEKYLLTQLDCGFKTLSFYHEVLD